jgi:hypothetical protein
VSCKMWRHSGEEKWRSELTAVFEI